MKYKLRAEFVNDLIDFIAAAKGKIKAYKIINDGIIPDVDFEFETKLPLWEIIDILKKIPDSHIMYQTIKPISEYTGERDYTV